MYNMKRSSTSLAGQTLPVRSILDATTHTHDAMTSHYIAHLQPPRTASHSPFAHLFLFDAGFLSDLHVFDPLRLAWTDLTAATAPWPPARAVAGTVAVAGRLLVHGGLGMAGASHRLRSESLMAIRYPATALLQTAAVCLAPIDRRRGRCVVGRERQGEISQGLDSAPALGPGLLRVSRGSGVHAMPGGRWGSQRVREGGEE